MSRINFRVRGRMVCSPTCKTSQKPNFQGRWPEWKPRRILTRNTTWCSWRNMFLLLRNWTLVTSSMWIGRVILDMGLWRLRRDQLPIIVWWGPHKEKKPKTLCSASFRKTCLTPHKNQVIRAPISIETYNSVLTRIPSFCSNHKYVHRNNSTSWIPLKLMTPKSTRLKQS